MTRLWHDGEPVPTWGTEETPAGFSWQGVHHSIQTIYNRWRLHTLWWDAGQAVWREYIKVVTGSGLLCLLYRDLLRGGWFLARVYD